MKTDIKESDIVNGDAFSPETFRAVGIPVMQVGLHRVTFHPDYDYSAEADHDRKCVVITSTLKAKIPNESDYSDEDRALDKEWRIRK